MLGNKPLRPFFDVSNFSMNFRGRTLGTAFLEEKPHWEQLLCMHQK
jgi:hypothetical protein